MNDLQSALMHKVCILIPLCNEEESIPTLRLKLAEVHQTLSQRFDVEYCFVDDGSTDNTVRLLPSVPPPNARYCIQMHSSNCGIGAAFRTGFQHAEADVVCTIDADCSYGPANLVSMIDAVLAGQADVMVASPYHPDGDVDGVQRWRLLLSMQCSRFYRMATPLQLYTYTSIFRAYRGSVVREVSFPSNGFVAAVEILLSAASLGYRIAEVPLTLRRRAAGHSKMRIARTIRAHCGLIGQCLRAGASGYPQFGRTVARANAQAATPAGALPATIVLDPILDTHALAAAVSQAALQSADGVPVLAEAPVPQVSTPHGWRFPLPLAGVLREQRDAQQLAKVSTLRPLIKPTEGSWPS